MCTTFGTHTPRFIICVFVLSDTEVYVDVKSVFACDIDSINRVGLSVILSETEIDRIQQKLLDFLQS